MSISLQSPVEPVSSRMPLAPAAVVLALAGAAWSLAALAPIGFSIAIVFLFAGPHNWLEARYMLQRMPARWGRLWHYFALGIGGTVLLTGGLAALSWGTRAEWLKGANFLVGLAIWNTLLIVWIMALAQFRAGQNPKRNWPWIIPCGCLAVSVAWLLPLGCSLALVYVHPLMSLWFLDRELSRTKSHWQGAYRLLLGLLPVALLALWIVLARTPNLPGDDSLAAAISDHAGGRILRGVSTHLLIATHTFLEMLHYGVWIIAIPALRLPQVPWNVHDVPLARRSLGWRRTILAIVVIGATAMFVLWGGFIADYTVTRDLYFTIATLHVLAEVPFLLRLL